MPDSLPFFLEPRNLAQEPAANHGGIEALWYTPARNVLTQLSDVGPLLVTNSLSMATGAVWYQLVSVRHTVRHKQTPTEGGRHQGQFKQQLTGTLARNTEGLAAGLELLDGEKLVVLYRDRNGYVWLVGTPEQPLSWKDVLDTGAEFPNRNNYDWTLSGETLRRVRPYLGSWTVSGRGLEYAVQLQQGTGGSVELRDNKGKLLALVPPGRTLVLNSGFRFIYTIQ
ncbi:hypothetical protein HER32_06745 [Hymenobacter sp. BT18]|uniref:hypothetical protein n=1 Tax=Hymenobacter sp. BT18 TaxID=2835648 RepID=UPI00143E6A74|nr:hypothetical protein [Hymenobacter sp. BT18]QIX60891.1 hypothetical protein HER32_06745 [Hymenobacter sp. BT18]